MSKSIGSFSFSNTYEDIMQAFSILDKAKKDPRRTMLVIAMVGLIAYSLTLLGSSYAPLGIIFAIIGIYVIINISTLPNLRRRKAAKKMTKDIKSYVMNLCENYIEIIEKGTSFRLDYKETKAVNSKNLLLLIYQGNLIVVPKRYMAEDEERYISYIASCCGERFSSI
jgi:hypothetical protein